MYGGILKLAGVDCPYWSGLLGSFEAEAPEAVPHVVTRLGTVSVVASIGQFTQSAGLSLAVLIQQEVRHPETKAVMLVLCGNRGQLSGLWPVADIINIYTERCPIIAYLDGAWGPLLWLAQCCRRLYATPTGAIGLFQCGLETGEIDEQTTLWMAADLERRRRWVTGATWARLAHDTVHGEQAEALGIVDSLAADPTALAERWQTGAEIR